MPYSDDLNSILTWYQNHVGAYDKAKWEQRVEERILHGLSHIPTKSTTLTSELIDLDLVQGSSFPKAKPKHGLFTVTRHALLRFIFLPLYRKWWTAQTSRHLYVVFLFLYIIQVFNVYLYLTLPITPSPSGPNLTEGPVNEHEVPEVIQPLASTIQTSEIIAPIVLMIVLTILHSQIVATHWSKKISGGLSFTNGSNGRHHRNNRIRKQSNILNAQTRGSGGSKTHIHSQVQQRSKRRSSGRDSRYPPSRRRSNALPSWTLTPISPTGGGSASAPYKGKQLDAPIVVGGESGTDLSRGSSHLSLSPSVTNKKVFFEDESKSLSSNNSDKDEGIAEEIVSETSYDHPCGTYFLASISDPILKKNLVESFNALEEEFGGCGTKAGAANNIKTTADASMLTAAIIPANANAFTSAENVDPAVVVEERRSNLRKRNLSKLSEVSTTSPSHSCGECSHNSHDSRSNEDDSSTDEEIDDEDECRNGEEEDEEVRSKSEWTAVTTNDSEDDDYVEEENNNSEDDEDGFDNETQLNDHPFAWEFQQVLHRSQSTKTSSPSCASSDKVSCTVWEGQEAKKADLTVLDISASIISKVERARENSDYLYLGIFFSCILAFLPCYWRLNSGLEIDVFDLTKIGHYLGDAINFAYGDDLKARIMILISSLERLCLSLFVFFLLAVAEKTYKQRFLYSKLFSRITSTRKAKKSGIPHFRLNKVRNIKTWLSIRSYLQRRGPQRSVDIIVSSTFIATLILIFFLSVELLKDSSRMYYLYNVEVIAWSLCLGIYLMRFMTLGSRISQKYRNLSVIITEQLNLYLKMEQKPHKKDELLVANNVLKLAAELLKELEDPFKITSFASNPYLYNVTRLVILSAFSGVLSEMLGFKLKLYKIKLK